VAPELGAGGEREGCGGRGAHVEGEGVVGVGGEDVWVRVAQGGGFGVVDYWGWRAGGLESSGQRGGEARRDDL